MLSLRLLKTADKRAEHRGLKQATGVAARKPGPHRGGLGVPVFLQAKVAVGHPSDPAELEADRVAEQVMRMPSLMVQRQCAACAAGGPTCPACDEERSITVSRKAESAAGGEAPASVHSVLRSPGQPLAASTRAFFEPRFGQNLSHVRVHTDGAAQQSASDVNALAYTVGSHVVFDAGRYAPGTSDGQRLLAHELTHVVQQSAAPLQLRRKPPYEDEKLDEEQVADVSPGSAPNDVLPAEDDIVVWRYINDALKANNGSYFDAWGELQDRRASSRANALDPNLAAAEHYLFARVLSKVAPSFLVADLDMAYGLAKDIGVVPSFTEYPVTKSTPFQKKWGITGAFEGSWLADWLW